MKSHRFEKGIAKALTVAMAMTMTLQMPTAVFAATKTADLTAFNIEGYAAPNTTGGGVIDESATNYIKVSNAEELLAALNKKDPSTNKAWAQSSYVIEITQDIDLGWNNLSATAQGYSCATQAASASTHPLLKETGVTKVYIEGRSNLTIYSKNGAKIKHACLDIKGETNNLIIRNLEFDEIWEWDDSGNYDSNDWDYITIEGASSNIWIDHCTFNKAYDGIVDVKKKSHDVTISWCQFLPGDMTEGSFFMQMMDYLEDLCHDFLPIRSILQHCCYL
jgi:pectate lyase